MKSSAGELFGVDPKKWETVSRTQGKFELLNGQKVAKVTSVMHGIGVHLWHHPPMYDERAPDLYVKEVEVESEEQWTELIKYEALF